MKNKEFEILPKSELETMETRELKILEAQCWWEEEQQKREAHIEYLRHVAIEKRMENEYDPFNTEFETLADKLRKQEEKLDKMFHRKMSIRTMGVDIQYILASRESLGDA